MENLRSVFLERVTHFGETFGDQVKGRSRKKLELLMDVPYVVHLRGYVLSFNIHLISYP